jgi:hypothetical protein
MTKEEESIEQEGVIELELPYKTVMPFLMKDKINPEEDPVNYVKSHIAHDAEVNRLQYGIDVRKGLGRILENLLDEPESFVDQDDHFIKMLVGIEERTGQEIYLHETMKCGGPVYLLSKQDDAKGLAELKSYTQELLAQGSDNDPLLAYLEKRDQT